MEDVLSKYIFTLNLKAIIVHFIHFLLNEFCQTLQSTFLISAVLQNAVMAQYQFREK
jgi:hypothetical protein